MAKNVTNEITADQHNAVRRAKKAAQRANAKANAAHKRAISGGSDLFTDLRSDNRNNFLEEQRELRASQALVAMRFITATRESACVHAFGSSTRVKANEACDIAEMAVQTFVESDPTFVGNFGTKVKQSSFALASREIRDSLTHEFGARMVESAIVTARQAIAFAMSHKLEKIDA